jgi:hypothetical protein
MDGAMSKIPIYFRNKRIDAVLLALGDLTPLGTDTDDYLLASIVANGLWAGFYLALRHPEWFAQLILEGNAILDSEFYDRDEEGQWTEKREWESNVDKLVNGDFPL